MGIIIPDDDEFKNAGGSPASLDTLCRIEPEWAANRLRVARKQIDEALAQVDRTAHASQVDMTGWRNCAVAMRAALESQEAGG